jgi:hypothetical protein
MKKFKVSNNIEKKISKRMTKQVCLMILSLGLLPQLVFADDLGIIESKSSHIAFGSRVSIDGIPVGGTEGSSYQIFGEWIFPKQKNGLFSLGGHIGLTPLNLHDGSTADNSNFMAGIQTRYQFVVHKNQLFVPIIGMDIDYYNFHFSTTTADGLGNITTTKGLSGIMTGFSAGIMLNLGAIDRSTARDSYLDLGVIRTYLTLEIEPIRAIGSSIDIISNLFYMGLRFEF